MNEKASAEALNRLIQLSVLLNRNLSEGLEGHGLSLSRAPVLWMISASGPQTQRQLADALRVSARNITGLVDSLVSDGFVTRSTHPRDRRALLVALTPHGKETVAQLALDRQQLTRGLFGEWGGIDLASFTQGLDRLVGKLRA